MKRLALKSSGAASLERRSCGILMHVTSLPGPHGSGDLGPEAHEFVEFLAAAGQSWWQMLPVGPPGPAPAFSPYDSSSAFAGSPWLVALTSPRRGARLRPPRGASSTTARRADFTAALQLRENLLRQGFAAFQRRRGDRGRAFRTFREANADWLEDYVLFAALRRQSGGQPWTAHEAGIRDRRPAALRAASEHLGEEIALQRYVQFEFDRQWRDLREHAHARGIGLIGDLPIFVAHDSADVWSHPGLFQLDARGKARRISGYPGDSFNEYGQRWGHPQYDWAQHERTGFAWWLRRFARIFELFDAVRIDHFLGFTRTWSIPASAPDARSGRWVKSPGDKLLSAVRRQLGPRQLIAEDLGHVTPADVRLREKHGLPPMRILQFGFGGDAGSAIHLPHNCARLCAAYTGSHDNNTLVGWYRELRGPERQRVRAYLGDCEAEPHQAALRALLASPANVVMFPLQDVLGLDARARMNTPGTVLGNWTWRLPPRNLDGVARRLRELTLLFDRGNATS